MSSPEEQILTLLHETIHLRLMCGALRERTIQTLQLERQCFLPSSNGGDEGWFCRQQLALAFFLWNFVDEILAEKYLSEHYPSLREPRLEHLLTLAACTPKTGLESPFPALKSYAYLLGAFAVGSD